MRKHWLIWTNNLKNRVWTQFLLKKCRGSFHDFSLITMHSCNLQNAKYRTLFDNNFHVVLYSDHSNENIYLTLHFSWSKWKFNWLKFLNKKKNMNKHYWLYYYCFSFFKRGAMHSQVTLHSCSLRQTKRKCK